MVLICYFIGDFMGKMKKIKTALKTLGGKAKTALKSPKVKAGLKIAAGVAAVAVTAGAGVLVGKKLAGGGIKDLISGKKAKKTGARGFISGAKSTKALLKKKYDQRARRKMRLGNLGGAKSDLRKKATVI